MTLYTYKTPVKENDSFTTPRPVTPKEAERILKTKLWDRQRPVRRLVVANYSRMMTTGVWRPTSVIHFAVVDGQEYLVDGQHRLAAVIDSNTTQQFTFLRHKVENPGEIARFYATIDRGLQRTTYDQMHAIGVDDFYGWNTTKTNMVFSAIRYINSGFGEGTQRVTYAGNEIEAMIEEYGVPAVKYVDLFERSIKKIQAGLRRRGTGSVILVTFKESWIHYGNKVDEFWNGVALDDGLRANDPRKLVVNHLLTTKVSGGGAKGTGIVSASYSSRYIANCFNAYVEDRDISRTAVKNERVPIKINGSRFNGR